MRIGFVGLGATVEQHAAAVPRDAVRAAVVAPVSAERDRFAQTFGVQCQYETLDEMLAAKVVDAVCLAGPRALRSAQAVACLKAGVAVLAETPMAIDADEAREMWCVAEATGTPLMVAHSWRFDADVHWMKSQRGRGALSSPLHSTIFAIETRMLVDAVDRGRFLFNDPQPVSVYATFNSSRQRDTGVVVVSWMCGSASVIESRADGMYEPRCVEAAYTAQMAHFVDCVRRGVQPSVNGAHGYLTMCIIDAAYASARLGKVIEL